MLVGVWVGGNGEAGGRRRYAKLVRHHGLDEPVSRQQDIGLGGDGLRQLEEDAGGLGEALRREEDGVLQLDWERPEGAPLE